MNHNSYMPENVIIKQRDYTDDYEARERKGKGSERGLFNEKNNSKIYIYNNEDLRREKWNKEILSGKRNDRNNGSNGYQILTQNSSDKKKVLKSSLKGERGKMDMSKNDNNSSYSNYSIKINKSSQKTELFSMMDENYRILYDQINKVLLDNVDTFVIGFIGRENVGKTTIVSHFSKIKNNKRGPKLISKKDTVGIDMYITEERVIILDTQPILRKFKSEKKRKNYENSIPENYSKEPDLWNSIQSFQFALFLFSICHVIVAVSDDINDISLWQFIRTIEKIKQETYGIPNNKSKNQYKQKTEENNENQNINNIEEDDIYPKVVFINNKCTPEYFSLEVARNYNKKFNRYFKDSKLKLNGLIKMPNITPENAINVANFYFLPFYKSQENQNSKSQGNNKNINKHIFKILIDKLRQQIYSIPRNNVYPLLEQKKNNEIQEKMKYSLNSLSINSFPKLSEKEWFTMSGKIWENIKVNFVNESAKLIEDSWKSSSMFSQN
ncbi:hypothetical protein U3516DRAFT_916372 [Neocallimastix sp. 'constans']